MAKIYASLEGKDQLTKRIKTMMGVVTDLKPFWREAFAPYYFKLLQDRFALGGMQRTSEGLFLAGTSWKPLSPKYRAWKNKHYPGQPILTLTKRLRNSLRWSGGHLGKEGIFLPGAKEVVIGTRVPYAAAVNAEREFLSRPNPKVFTPMLKDWLVKTIQKKTGKK